MRATLLMLYAVAIPPTEYDRPYVGTLDIVYAEPKEIGTLCGLPGIVKACAMTSPGHCRIIFPMDTGVYPRKTLDLLMRHEIAHCNGWRHE